MKKVISVVLAAFLLFVGAATAFAAGSIPQPVLDARDSVVLIEVHGADGAWTGSGFPIGTGNTAEYVITNHHVSGEVNSESIVYYEDYKYVAAKIVASNEAADWCILKLDEPIPLKPFSLYDGEPSKLVGNEAYALGFPGSSSALFADNGSTAEDVTITNGIVSAAKKTGNTGAQALQMNVSVHYGNSGGPLINAKGVVIGINSFISLEDANLNGAMAISEVIPTLNKEGIAFKASSNILYSGTIWVILIPAAAVVLFLLWFFLLRKKFKRDKTISLAEYLEKSGARFEYDRAITLLAPVATQLQAMHREGKTHLAVYPQNIRVQFSSGKAILLPAKKQELLSGYAAPEQYKEFEQKGAFTDVYQLGAVLYRLLVGERLPDVMTRIESDVSVQEKIGALPLLDNRKQALKLCISMKPDLRISNMEQFMSALRIMPEMAVLPESLVKKERKKWEPKKKRRVITLSVVGTAVAVVGILTGLFITNYNNASAFLMDGKFAQASKAISGLPDIADVPLIKNMAEAGELAEANKFDEARALLVGIEDLAGAQLILKQIDLYQGLNLIERGDAENGEKYIETYLSKNPGEDRDLINYMRGFAYAQARDFMTAESIFKEIEGEEAHVAAAQCAIAMATELLNKGEEASEADLLAVFELLMPYEDVEEARVLADGLREVIYRSIVDAYESGNNSSAWHNIATYFSYVHDYKDMSAYYEKIHERRFLS